MPLFTNRLVRPCSRRQGSASSRFRGHVIAAVAFTGLLFGQVAIAAESPAAAAPTAQPAGLKTPSKTEADKAQKKPGKSSGGASGTKTAAGKSPTGAEGASGSKAPSGESAGAVPGIAKPAEKSPGIAPGKGEPAGVAKAGVVGSQPVAAYNGPDPCTLATKGDSPVAKACAEGGVKAAKATMKELAKAGRAAGVKYQCDDCHINDADYAQLSKGAEEKFAKLLAATKK